MAQKLIKRVVCEAYDENLCVGCSENRKGKLSAGKALAGARRADNICHTMRGSMFECRSLRLIEDDPLGVELTICTQQKDQ